MDTKFSVSLHIMIFISETKEISSSELIAKSVNTNSSYVRKIISQLKQSKLIDSHQGKAGFFLAKEKDEITLADIYNSIYPRRSILNIHENTNMECPIGANIKKLLIPTFDKAQSAFIKELNKKTLQQLIRDLYKIGEK